MSAPPTAARPLYNRARPQRRHRPLSSQPHHTYRDPLSSASTGEMASERRTLIALLLTLLALSALTPPAAGDPLNIGTCIRNCAQCKKMFGAYFEGQLCADTCVKFKGKLVPDCEDVASIAPFLNKFE